MCQLGFLFDISGVTPTALAWLGTRDRPSDCEMSQGWEAGVVMYHDVDPTNITVR